MSTFFTFILHRQTKDANYIPGKLQNNLLFFMNRYNLYTPYIIHRNQTILLDTVGLDFFYDPDNFGSLAIPYVVILFNIKPRDIGQYFYANKFLSQNKIYFNALNNYSQQYIYTNIAASVKTDKNTVEKIYSVNGLPLSFVDETNLRYIYEGTIAIRWLKLPLYFDPADPYNSSNLVPVKYEPNGQRQIDNYNNLLYMETQWYDYTFDKLLIYNLDKRCRYLLLNNVQFEQQIPIDGRLNICSVLSLTDTTSDEQEIKTRREPYVFDMPLNINALYQTLGPGGVTNNPTLWTLVSSFNNIVGLDSSTCEINFDCVLGSMTPLYGNKTLKLTQQIRPYDLISYTSLQANFTVNPQGEIQYLEGSLIYRFEIKQESTASINQLGITYKHLSDPVSWPNRFVTYKKATGQWQNTTFNQTNTYYDITYFVWDTKELIGQLDIPANTWKTWIISNRKGKDFLAPNNYLQTTRDLKNIARATAANLLKREFGLPSWFSPRHVRTCEMGIWPIMNLTSFFDYDLSQYWRSSSTVTLASTGISGDTLAGNYMQPSLVSNILDAITETLIYNTALTQATVSSSVLYYHAVDENPFTEGVRITRGFFNYKQYFQMKNFPYYMIKKSFDLVTDMDYISPSEGFRQTVLFQLNTIQFTQYKEITCIVLPSYANTTYSDANLLSRGIAIKCSLSRRRRGIRPYLFLEQGGKSFFTWEHFELASTFDFGIYYPPNKSNARTQTTLFRNVDSRGNLQDRMDIYLLFK